MVAPPFVAATSATVDGGRNLTLGRPAGTSANDALLAFVSINGGSASGSPSVTPPAGWAQVHLTRSGYSTLQTFTRTAGSSEPASYTFTLPANDDMVGVLAAYRAGAVDVSAQYSSEGDSSASAPTVTTTGADRTVLSAYASGTSIDSTPPSGTTVRGDEWSAGVYASLLVVDYEQATAGTTDPKTATYSSATDWATQTIALYATNTAPNAPILVAPADASTIDRNVSQRFDWDFSDPNAGDSQSAYNFRYRAVGAATWTETGWQASTQTYHDVSGGTFTDGVDYEWQVATKDAQGVAGPFSSSWFFTAENPFLSATVNAASETSTAQPLGRVKRKALGVAVDTSTALPLARRKTKALGLVTETNTARSIVTRPRIIVALGVATEAVTALPLTASQRYPDFFFTPPVGKVRAPMSMQKPFRFYGVTVSSSVVFRNGHFQEVRSPEADEVDDLVEGVTWFPGGRTHQVDKDTKLLLEADGFTVDSV